MLGQATKATTVACSLRHLLGGPGSAAAQVRSWQE